MMGFLAGWGWVTIFVSVLGSGYGFYESAALQSTIFGVLSVLVLLSGFYLGYLGVKVDEIQGIVTSMSASSSSRTSVEQLARQIADLRATTSSTRAESHFDGLIELVQGLPVPQGILQGLLLPLSEGRVSFLHGRESEAEDRLRTFVKLVSIQGEATVDSRQKERLVNKANKILSELWLAS